MPKNYYCDKIYPIVIFICRLILIGGNMFLDVLPIKDPKHDPFNKPETTIRVEGDNGNANQMSKVAPATMIIALLVIVAVVVIVAVTKVVNKELRNA